MDRAQLVADIGRELKGRRLIWFGTRGDDAEGLTDIPEFSAAFSVINEYRKRSTILSMAFEDAVGYRVDLDSHDIDDEFGTGNLTQMRRAMLQATSVPSAVVTYRSSTFVSAVCFARRDRCRYVGMFKDHQAAFEHKPWVETEISDLGMDTIPWRYVADEDQLETLRYLDSGPILLRRSHSSGGTGFTCVSDHDSLLQAWPQEPEAFVSVAPFLSGGIPINVGAVVWRDASVTIHPASVQLTGIPEFTTRSLGYCGNDFGAFRALGSEITDRVDRDTRAIGKWLHSRGYRGAFGVDYLLVKGKLLFTEVNPRLQGSTHLSSQVSAGAGESCILLEHLAACLGIAAPEPQPLRQVGEYAGTYSHFVVHSREHEDSEVDVSNLLDEIGSVFPIMRSDVLLASGIPARTGATLVRCTVDKQLTDEGFELRPEWKISGTLGTTFERSASG